MIASTSVVASSKRMPAFEPIASASARRFLIAASGTATGAPFASTARSAMSALGRSTSKPARRFVIFSARPIRRFSS